MRNKLIIKLSVIKSVNDMPKDLNKKEKVWMDKLQKLLDECPSKRIGFFTIGDRDLTLFDLERSDEISDLMNSGRGNTDFCVAVRELDAGFEWPYEANNFPTPVESTAG